MLIFDELKLQCKKPEGKTKLFGRLTLICKLFRLLCQPELFRNLVVRLSTPGVKPRPLKWLKALARGNTRATALAHHVRDLTIANWTRKPQPETSQGDVGAEVLRYFPKVQAINLVDVPLSSELLAAMSQLPELMRLKGSQISEDAKVPSAACPCLKDISYHSQQRPDLVGSVLSRLIDPSRFVSLDLGSLRSTQAS